MVPASPTQGDPLGLRVAFSIGVGMRDGALLSGVLPWPRNQGLTDTDSVLERTLNQEQGN